MRNILLSTSATLILALAAPALAQTSPTNTGSDPAAGAPQEQQADAQSPKKKHHKGDEAPPSSGTDPTGSANGNGNSASELGDGASSGSQAPPSTPQH